MKKKARFLVFPIVVAILMLFSTTAMAAMDELGQSLLFGYYDIRTEAQGGPGLTDNYYTVTNTDNSYIQSHLRVRTGKDSIELLDFDFILSPNDVFAFDIYQDPTTEATVFASCDPGTLMLSGFALNYDRDGDGKDDCYVLDSSLFPAMLSLITTCTALTPDKALAETREGYVEVISEGLFLFTGTAGCTTANIQTGKFLLYDWVDGKKSVDVNGYDGAEIAADGGVGDLNVGDAADNCDWDYPGNILYGRIYYVDYDPLKLTFNRMGAQNAVPLRDTRRDEREKQFDCNGDGIATTSECAAIIHSIDYPSEIARTDAAELAGEAAAGWAYSAPSAAPVSGANDMNYCLFDPTTTPVNTVNKTGAAATFGPTLADIYLIVDGPGGPAIDYYRDGKWQTAVYNVDQVNSGKFTAFGAVSTASSHYWNYGAANPGIPVTTFASTFPLKHFTDASIQVRVDEFYNNDESECRVAIGKFISPGLPGAPTYVSEVHISDPLTDCPTTHIEGYIVWRYNVTSDQAGAVAEAAGIDVNHNKTTTEKRTNVTNYAPWVEAFSINSSDLLYSTTPMTVLIYGVTGTYPTW